MTERVTHVGKQEEQASRRKGADKGMGGGMTRRQNGMNSISHSPEERLGVPVPGAVSPTSAGTLGPLLRKPQPYLLHLGTFRLGSWASIPDPGSSASLHNFLSAHPFT